MHILFDGANIWVASGAAQHLVTKLNPATGARTEYELERAPRLLAFDGTYLWVASTDGQLTRMTP